jgi:hypothetical protein
MKKCGFVPNAGNGLKINKPRKGQKGLVFHQAFFYGAYL